MATDPNDPLGALRAINRRFAEEDERHAAAKRALRAERAAEVRRLRGRPPAGLGLSHGQIAEGMGGISRGRVQQWEQAT
jgi:DNA-binding transcriptional regulator YiaG